MSVHSIIARRRRSLSLFLLSLLGGVLISLQFAAPTAAFALPAVTPAPTVGTNMALDLASAAVVRIRTTYVPTSTSASTQSPTLASASSAEKGLATGAQCTGLGVLIGSWKAVGTEQSNWILTDGDLLNPTHALCNSINSATRLSSIEVFASDTYKGGGALLDTIQCQASSASSPCANGVFHWCHSETDCSNRLAVVPLNLNTEQPYINLATTNQVPQSGIELRDPSASLPFPPPAAQAEQYLTPHALNIPSTPASLSSVQSEPGMPLINSQGELVGMHLLNDVSFRFATEIKAYMPAPHANTLNSNWKNGVVAFYAKKYPEAKSAFQAVLNESGNQFAGATAFLHLIPANSTTETPIQTPTQSFLGIPLLWWLCLAVLVALMAVLIIVNQTIGRAGSRRRRERMRELERFKSEEAEAERIANIEAQRQQEHPPLPPVAPLPQAMPVAANHVQSESPASSPASLHCPHCGQMVQPDVTYCPNCRYLLSPSASGLRLRAIPAVPPPPDAPPMPAYNGQAAPPISEQPTALITPLSERPTQAFPLKDDQVAADKTVVPTGKQARNRLQGLAVGHLSDPGIKRKQRPNEDSIFAMQGRRVLNGQMQPFGFFVVADGMGGHANGQDASRLAIQTIINFVLPKLAEKEDLNDEGYVKLLTEGVQCANQAVHDQNQRERGDMGTTMTSALVIGSIAYVANVGDSRTYLYREGQGLGKVTHDHSVVASLVDAGIIKPDDVYTHPKRNQIYRSLGEKPVVEVDPFQVQLQPGDKLLLCSDGLWDMTRDPAIEKVLTNPVDPSQTVNDLIQLALHGGGEDNVSVIVVQVIEVTKRTGKAGMQILTKPDSVSAPALP